MIKLTDILKEISEKDSISSILKQLIVQDLGYLIGFDEGEIEDEEEWINEWEWDNKSYRVLTDGIYFIVFIDNDPKIIHELYQDLEDWLPGSNDLREEYNEEYFQLAIEEAYKNNMKYITNMLTFNNTGTIDDLKMASINNKKQLLYFFNI